MGSARASEATRLLNRYAGGDRSVERALLDAVYGELHALAEACMQGQAPRHTLQPTALGHEAWLRLVNQEELVVDARAQFYGLAGKIMRSVLVDHARRVQRQKRGGERRPMALEALEREPAQARPLGTAELLDIEGALTRLEELEPGLARIVEMRFFAGLSHPEIAGHLGVSLRTVENHWRLARAWLHANLSR
jgi:RNA polymerase sigma factor (TIGR02999 family)